MIKITNGKEIENFDGDSEKADGMLIHQESIEQGTDPLDPTADLSSIITKSINIHAEGQLNKKLIGNFGVAQNKRISRSAGSYTDDESSLVLRTAFELGSEPRLNTSNDLDPNDEENESITLPKCLPEGQQELLEKWLKTAPDLISSQENLYPDEYLGTSSGTVSQNSPLMARTDALLSTKSFNLVKPKP